MSLRGHHVLVTGAGGFIGSHLVEALVRAGCEVRAFLRYTSTGGWGSLDLLSQEVRDVVEPFLGDITEFESVRHALKGVDMAFHLAALVGIPYSYKHPREVFDVNVVGTLNILTASGEQGLARLVVTSTSEVYGTAQHVPITEEHSLHPQSPYAATKVAADALAQSFFHAFKLPVVIVRPFNAYGPRQSARAVIPTIISQAIRRSEVRLGAVSPTRDFTYVTDTVRGFLRAAEVPEAIGEVINLGSGFEISIGDLVTRIGGLLGKELWITTDEERLRPESSEVNRLWADNSKAARILGWKPEVDLDVGLRQTIAWVSENLRLFDPNSYQV